MDEFGSRAVFRLRYKNKPRSSERGAERIVNRGNILRATGGQGAADGAGERVQDTTQEVWLGC